MPGRSQPQPFGPLRIRLFRHIKQKRQLFDAAVGLLKLFGKSTRQSFPRGNVVGIQFEFLHEPIGHRHSFVAIGRRDQICLVVKRVTQGGQWNRRGNLLCAQLRYRARQLIHAELRHVRQVACRQTVANHLQRALRRLRIVGERQLPIGETMQRNRKLRAAGSLLIADFQNRLLA